MVIGDGYGFMTSLLKMRYPQATVICVNLGKVLMFDAAYTKMACPGENCSLIDKKEDFNNAKQGSVLFLEAEKYELLYSLPVGLFINISSMQELDRNAIKTYFDIMRSSTVESLFYSCNRIEKELPDGTIIRFDDYPWDKKDEIIIDEKCPWCQKYPVNKPPFWRRLDGPTQHRLVKLYRRS